MATPVDRGGLCLVLGGVRSGKSDFAMALAERRAKGPGLRPVYVATAPASYAESGPDSGTSRNTDEEMKARIDLHRAGRGAAWDTIEEQVEITRVVEEGGAKAVLLIDCLTLWITNLMGQGFQDADIIERAEVFAACAAKAQSSVIVVSNEVGQGIVPQSALGRRFRDLSGIVNQRVAAFAKDVYLVTAGIAQKIKG